VSAAPARRKDESAMSGFCGELYEIYGAALGEVAAAGWVGEVLVGFEGESVFAGGGAVGGGEE
jgi:hypothetical protein